MRALLLLPLPFALTVYACSDDSTGGNQPAGDASADAAQDTGENDATTDGEAGLTGDPCGDRSGLANASWPMAGGCPKRGGYAPVSGPRSTAIRFRARLPAAGTSPVVDIDGTIHVATADGRLLTVDLGGSIADAGAPAPGDAGSNDAGSDAADGGDATAPGDAGDAGADAEAKDAGSDASTTTGTSLAIGKDGQLVYGESNGTAYAFATTPAASWSRALVAPFTGTPVIGPSGNVYIAAGGSLHALSLATGQELWVQSTHDSAGSPALGDGETIYVGSADKHVYAFSKSGTPGWSFATGAPLVAPASVLVDLTGTVIAADQAGTVYAIAPDTGKERWRASLGAPVVSGCAAGLDAAVYCSTSDGKIHALEPTGKARWTYVTNGATTAPIVDKDGVVYVGSEDGHIYAIAPSGKLRLAVTVFGPVRAQPAMGADGAIYVTTDTELVGVGP
jgi:outer membrane protein assembly factor BamB